MFCSAATHRRVDLGSLPSEDEQALERAGEPALERPALECVVSLATSATGAKLAGSLGELSSRRALN